MIRVIAPHRLIWGFGDGSTLPVYDTSLGRLGGVICWENYMPLLRMAMYAKGIQLWCALTSDSRDSWVATMQHIACEGRCFVLSANQFVRRSDYPEDYPIEGDHEPEAVLCRGASMIVSPLGEVLAGPEIQGEVILRAELDLGKIAEGKYDFDVVGHYARPDVFRLTVDERPTPAVVTERGEATSAGGLRATGRCHAGVRRRPARRQGGVLRASRLGPAAGARAEVRTLLSFTLELFDLEPRFAYSLESEQIDGSVTFDTDDYIVEARLTKDAVQREDVDIFAAKVRRKGKNALGLFVSVGGFSKGALDAYSESTPFMAMDGVDLVAVLEQQIRLDDLLRRKKRHANETGECFLPVGRIADL